MLIKRRYLAPEVVQEMQQTYLDMMQVCSPASDVYAFGMLVYEVISNQVPYAEHSDERKVALMVRDGVLPVFNMQALQHNAGYQTILSTALVPDPVARPNFIELLELIDDLQ